MKCHHLNDINKCGYRENSTCWIMTKYSLYECPHDLYKVSSTKKRTEKRWFRPKVRI